MAAANAPVSFDEIIQADRKKRNEVLAQQLLGSSRRSSVPARKQNGLPGASLASRVGIQKRSSSATPKPTTKRDNLESEWQHDLHHVNNPKTSRRSVISRTHSSGNVERGQRLYSHLQKEISANGTSGSVNVRGSSNASSMSIRGIASNGPWVVIASNFAPGTTAADIQAAVEPVGGDVQSCDLISASPTVMAEIVFTDRDGAENVIATFNNQKADGRLLYVYMKQGGPSPRLQRPASHGLDASADNARRDTDTMTREELHKDAVPSDVEPDSRKGREDEMMDVDEPRSTRDEYSGRNQPRPDDWDRRRPEPRYQDNRYGYRGSYDRRDYHRGTPSGYPGPRYSNYRSR